MFYKKYKGDKSMKSYQEHYLSEEHDKKTCPFNRSYLCNGHCAWFDHEEQDCRMIGGFWKITTSINNFADIIEYYKEKLEDKNDKREFKY